MYVHKSSNFPEKSQIHPSFSYYGKIAIITIIHQREKKSKFREDMEPSDSEQDWYKFIFNRMISTLNDPIDFKKFRENKMSFITDLVTRTVIEGSGFLIAPLLTKVPFPTTR